MVPSRHEPVRSSTTCGNATASTGGAESGTRTFEAKLAATWRDVDRWVTRQHVVENAHDAGDR
jgi:hypothetical protein